MQAVLDIEVKRWSDMSVDELTSRLTDLRNYQLERGGIVYQFEVQLLENTDDYVHIDVSVDDGRLPYSLRPLGTDFIKKKS